MFRKLNVFALTFFALAVITGIYVQAKPVYASDSNGSEDNFWRANQTGFGTSTNYNGIGSTTWHNYGDGTKSYVTISSHSAQFADPGSGNYGIPIWSGDGWNSNGGDSLAEFSATYSSPHGGFYLPLNFAPDASQGYECRANYNSDHIELARRASNSTTIETSAGYTFSTGKKFWMRCNEDGSGVLKMKIWADGTLEPTTWNLSWTDSGPLGSNYSGLGNWFASGGSDTYKVYFFAFSSTPTTAAIPATLDSSVDQFATQQANDGKYMVDLEEFGSSAQITTTTDNRTKFIVTNSAISQTNGAPGAYPSIDTGCHSSGNCESGTNFPVQVSSVETAGTVTTSVDTTVPGANSGTNSYDDAYDIYFTSGNQTGWNNPTEMMIWLDNTSDLNPAGDEVATNVSIGGKNYNVWYSGTAPGGIVTYQLATPDHDLTNFDLGPLTTDAVTRGYIGSTSWYMEYVDLGFEIWKDSPGLSVNSYSVCVNGSC